MSKALHLSETEKDRIQDQLAQALARARILWPSRSKHVTARINGYEPTGIYVPEDVRHIVNRRAS